MKFACLIVLLCSLFVYLGLWQLQRRDLKENLEHQRTLAMQASPINLQDLPNTLAASGGSSWISSVLYHHLAIEGNFLNEKNILIDNQILKGQPGYRILTPFKPQNHDKLILIDRGFIAWGPTREKLPINEILNPIIMTRKTVTHLTGMITTLSQGILLKEDQEESPSSASSWPLLIQKLDYAKLATKLESPVYPFLLQLPAESPYTFHLIPSSLGLSADRHLGYAVQWFTMAIALVLYYVFRQMRNRKKNE